MEKRYRLSFDGTGLQLLGWGLLATLLSMLIIPAAWGAVMIYRWFAEHLVFPGGVRASFEGRGREMWGYFIALSLLGLVPQLSELIDNEAHSGLAYFALVLLMLPITSAILLKITRWFFERLRLSDGTMFRFRGDYLPFFGWMLLIILSFLTIIGWAWAEVGMIRWICRKIDAGPKTVSFVGSGWGLLWRCVLACLARILIVPIPLVGLCVIKWIVGNIVITETAPLLQENDDPPFVLSPA